MESKLSQILEEYISLAANDNIQSLCAPLKKLNISHFLYVKEDSEGRRTYLTNGKPWLRYYFSNQLYEEGAFGNYAFNQGKYLWSSINVCEKMFSKAAKLFNLVHGMTFIKKEKDCSHYFHYAAPGNKPEVYNIYLNKTELLEIFNLYFLEQANPIIQRMEKIDYGINFKAMMIGRKNYLINSTDDSDFLNWISPDQIYFPTLEKRLHMTKRERDCMYWLV